MPVAKFDRRLPPIDAWLPAEDGAWNLGQAASKEVAHLISEYTAPLTVGHVNAYVVFVPDRTEVTRYEWTLRETTEDGTPVKRKRTTRFGELRWNPKKPGVFTVEVKLMDSNGEVVTLELPPQEVEPLPWKIKKLDKILDKVSPAGLTSSRVVCDLLGYITNAVETTGNVISKRFLCAVAHKSLMMRGRRVAAESLYPGHIGRGGLRRLPPPSPEKFVTNEPKGICRIWPAVAAIYLYPEDNGQATTKSVNDRYKGLDEQAKIDICNLLRFPKTNLLVAAKLLAAQHAEWQEAISAGDAELDGSHNLETPMGIKSLATIFDAGHHRLAKFERKRGKRQLSINNFGRQVEQSTQLPIFEILVDPSDENHAIVTEWEEAEDDEDRAKARVYFAGGVIQYVLLYDDLKKAWNTTDLLGWIVDNIKPVEVSTKNSQGDAIFPHAVHLHRSLEDRLLRAVENTAWPEGFTFKKVGGFNPRRIAGYQKLSNHAKGAAIDFDHPSNPHWKGPEMRDINKLLGQKVWETQKKSFKPSLYDDLAEANSSFMVVMSSIQQTDGSYDFSELADSESLESLLNLSKAAAAGGFLTIPRAFVCSMIEQGFGWGGHYPRSRDFMHFEYPPVAGTPEGECE